MNSIPKLKPCAHCGDDDARLLRTVGNDGEVYWCVSCRNCGIQTIDYPETCEACDTYGNAVKATAEAIECAVRTWNTRVSNGCQHKNSNNFTVDMNNMSVDDIVNLTKRAYDVLADKASKVIDRINEYKDDD